MGWNACSNLIRDRFSWPYMQQDAESHDISCEHCIKLMAKPEVAELHPTLMTPPWSWVIWTISLKSLRRGTGTSISWSLLATSLIMLRPLSHHHKQPKKLTLLSGRTSSFIMNFLRVFSQSRTGTLKVSWHKSYVN